MKITIPRKVITFDEIEIDTDKIREEIPETFQEQVYYPAPKGKRIWYKSPHFFVTRPNSERLAADEIEIESIKYYGDDCGKIDFCLRKNPSEKFEYHWGDDYDGGRYEHFYKKEEGETISSYDYKFDIAIPSLIVPYPDEKRIINGVDCVHLSSIEVDLQDCQYFLDMIAYSNRIQPSESPFDQNWTTERKELPYEEYV